MRISDWSSDVCSSDLVARALASDIGVSQQLRLGRLAALVASYENSKVGRTLATPLKDDGPVRVVRAYESAKLFRASANNCLSRSLAMARRLARLRCAALPVVGVCAPPFGIGRASCRGE